MRNLLKYILGTAVAAIISIFVSRALRGALGGDWAAIAAIAAAGAVYVLVTLLLRTELLIWMHVHLPVKLQLLRGYYPVSEGEHHE